ncbi:Sulphur relay, TusB/DsrH like protein [Aduncisulcus paluster]|uniref:Sulphur relay, TusB/DsrH like protein n=1 Tax=Aduncisulcus paluster TaxID=2918883 RepID=A0ABQ5JYH9_9EUKA|nr:Sulphur relay, TusB/DsrH like protein [Aduncisulcus paluster]
MLFFVNKPEEKVLERIAFVGGDEDKALLLVGDAVVLGTAHWEEKFEDMDVEDIYVAKDAVDARNIELSDNWEVVDYAGMVDLLLGGDEKVVSL